MKLLILCPGKIAASVDKINCFTDVLNYYLPNELAALTDTTIMQIPDRDGDQLREVFSTIDVDGYDVILTLGLRFYSKIDAETTALLRNRFTGLFCQTHDGSRLDHDPVDITFTFKNDDDRMRKKQDWFKRHRKFNACMGWAADSELNFPRQDPANLRILVDHTNYGDNDIDKTAEVLTQIKEFVESKIWQPKFKSVSVRRFDSGQVVDVDFNNLEISRYNRTTIPFSEITKEHCAAHIFCVTHPESVGLVVLETAMAGALPVVPTGFVPKDRLKTVRHYTWDSQIDWKEVLLNINIMSSRRKALNNSWKNVAMNIYQELLSRINKGKKND